DCILLAGRYTLLDQSALAGLLPHCEKKDIAVVLGGPFNSGVLATGLGDAARYDYGKVPDEIAVRVKRIEETCLRHDVDLRAAALQFPLAHPAIAGVIPGAVSPDELTGNLASLTAKIPDAFWSELVEQGLIDPGAPLPQTTGRE
ncbi:MAG: aldo/keto reductase, partial [Hyphomicrobiaceae bacterium]